MSKTKDIHSNSNTLYRPAVNSTILHHSTRTSDYQLSADSHCVLLFRYSSLLVLKIDADLSIYFSRNSTISA